MPHDVLAVVFLLLVLAATLVWVAISLVRSPLTPAQSVLYFGALLLTRVLWRAQLPKDLPIDSDKGAVLVCNHRSSADPFFIQSSTFRPVYWMVAREYCEHPILGGFLRICEVVPVGRGGVDTAATKAAIRVVARGGIIGMFPEGRINTSDEFVLPGRPGAVLIALKARALLVPCYIEGSPYAGEVWSPFLMPAKVRLQFGEPIDLSPYFDRQREPAVVQQLMLRCIAAIAELAGRKDHQPKLAGRYWKPTREELQAGREATHPAS